MQEQVARAEAKNAALEKEKAALAEELRDAEATAAAKADATGFRRSRSTRR